MQRCQICQTILGVNTLGVYMISSKRWDACISGMGRMVANLTKEEQRDLRPFIRDSRRLQNIQSTRDTAHSYNTTFESNFCVQEHSGSISLLPRRWWQLVLPKSRKRHRLSHDTNTQDEDQHNHPREYLIFVIITWFPTSLWQWLINYFTSMLVRVHSLSDIY
jgi:hypothetical protein